MEEEEKEGVLDWEKKYFLLENSLLKFKDQTAKIRDVLKEKMQELEEQKMAAIIRADSAEQQVRVMEQQLAAMNWKPRDLDMRIQDLEKDCHEKDRTIKDLGEQLEAQRSQRQHDAHLVEQKAGKIKDWVANKLQQLEQQNQGLLMDNEILQDQVEILRERLQALPAFAAKEIYRISQQSQDMLSEPSMAIGSRPYSEASGISHNLRPYSGVSTPSQNLVPQVIARIHQSEVQVSSPDSGANIRSISQVLGSQSGSDILGLGSGSQISDAPDIPERPSFTAIEAFQRDQGEFDNGTSSPSDRHSSPDVFQDISENESDDSMADIDQDALYQEVDQNHESTYEPKRKFPPGIKIERRLFQEPHLFDSFVSSSNGSEEMLGRSVIIHRLDSNQNNLHNSDQEIQVVSVEGSVSVSPTTPHSPLNPFPNSPETEVDSLQAEQISSTVSAIATLPRTRRSKDKPPLHRTENHKVTVPPFPVQQEKLHAEIHEPPVSPSHKHSPSHMLPSNKASLPPTRGRLHTWESRSYAVPKTRQKQYFERKPRTGDTTPIANMFRDLNVPVFATLKGKAAKIRSTPFTEETSSDSSDEENVISSIPNQMSSTKLAASPIPSRSTSREKKPQQINQSQSGATKRGVSMASEISCDYADPPDDTSSKSDSDNAEPEEKLLKYAADSHKHDTLEKGGYLSKLGGKVKSWKKRWFVLRSGELFYYKSQHDVLRKPQGSIKLDDQTRITHAIGELTFEVTNSKKTYYFTTESLVDTERWIRVLQKVLKRQATNSLLTHLESKAVIRGWITKVKNGVTRKAWCVLIGKHFLYYKTRSDKTPYGQLNLSNSRIEEVDTTCDSDDEIEVSQSCHHVLAIWPTYQGPTYIIVPSKQEKDSWLYHLTVAAGGGTGNVGTDFEQLIAKLIELDGDASSMFWKHPILLHCKEPISRPLTTLPSEELQEKSLELFRSVFQFVYTVIESPSLDFHVTLAQSILQTCIQHPELQNELYCQLIKQTSRHPVQHKTAVQNLLLCGKHSWYLCHVTPTSPTNSIVDLSESKLNPASHVILQGWQLLSMCVSLFLPKQSIMWLLKVHLQRNADPKTEIGKYAIFCQRALERTILKGCREAKPSRMEVMSILLRHPYHHSQPISIPVHFHNGSYQVVSFDGSTTVQEFLQTLNKTLGVRESALSGFALFTDDPGERAIEHCLHANLKICDVISKWEQGYRDHHSGSLDSSKTIRILYQNRLYMKSSCAFETEREKILLAYQVNEDIIQGSFPLNKDLALELASLMAQIEFGDIKSVESSQVSGATGSTQSQSNTAQQLTAIIERFYPKKYRDMEEEEHRAFIDKLVERWTALRGRTTQDCVRIYLAVARKWPFCGAKLYLAKIKGAANPDEEVWLAVEEEGIGVLEYVTMQPMTMYDYKSVITFGGWKEDFMIVVSQLIESAPHHYEHRTEKLLFIMPKAKILELTLLLASYINIRVQASSQDNNMDV